MSGASEYQESSKSPESIVWKILDALVSPFLSCKGWSEKMNATERRVSFGGNGSGLCYE